MHPFRIAILIFLVGASVANYFAMKQYDDRFAAVAQTPIPRTRFNPNDPFGSGLPATPDNPLLSTSNPLLSTEPPRDASGDIDWSKVAKEDQDRADATARPDPYTAGLESAARDKAWMREAIIVTIAGVAWFLVRP